MQEAALRQGQPSWHKDPFFQYPLTRFETSTGPIDLPILYYDNSVAMALYLVDADKASAQVKDPRLEVVRMVGQKALVGVAFYEYRHSAVGAYNEVGVAVAVAPRGSQLPAVPVLSMLGPLDKATLGLHILDLPVTTEAACSAGREVWGYPKFITPIGFELNGARFRGSVTEPGSGQEMLVMEGRLGPSVPGPLLDLVLFSSLPNGPLLRTLVNTRGGASVCLPGTMRLSLPTASRHPMVERLRALGIDRLKPVCVCTSHKLQLRLNAGAQVPA